MSQLEVTEHEEGASFTVVVTPRSRRDAILGVRDGALRVALCAPPVEGAANEALCKLLAKRLGVSKSAVEIIHGQSSRRKVVQVRGIRRRDVLFTNDK